MVSPISITHQFNGDASAADLVDAAQLDTQLGNLASTINSEIAERQRTLRDGSGLASQVVRFTSLHPEVTALLLADGIIPLQAVNVVSVANQGVLSGLLTIDSYTLVAGDRLLLTAQADSLQNGIWVAAVGAWTRPSDAASGASLARYTLVSSINGLVYVGSSWFLNAATTVDSAAQAWLVYQAQASVTPVTRGGTGANNAPAALTNLGLTAFGQSLVDDADAATARATLGITGVNPASGAADTVLTTTGVNAVWQKIATANIADNATTNAKLATVASQTFKGRTTAAVGNVEDLTAAQAAAILPAFVGDSGAGGTKGSVPAPAAGDAVAGKALLANGAWGFSSLPYWGKITSATTIAITAAVSATLNRVHVITGTSADYDITISGLSPATGDVIGFYVKDFAAASKQFRLDAGGTVKIAGRTRYLTLLHTNVVLLQWDGTDWQPLVLNLDTPWINAGASTITGTVTNPTKGTGTTYDIVYWRRFGNEMCVRYEYRHSIAGAAGSGDYLWAIPIGTIDTALVTAENGAGSSNTAATSGLGSGRGDLNGTVFLINSSVYDTTKLRFGVSTSPNFMSNGSTSFANAVLRFHGIAILPMTNW